MLVLTRKLMEKLYIGTDVCVTVVRLEGGQVRLGIEAPREVSVVRAELVDGKVGAPPAAAAAGSHPASIPTPKSAPLRIRPVEARGIDIRHPEPSR